MQKHIAENYFVGLESFSKAIDCLPQLEDTNDTISTNYIELNFTLDVEDETFENKDSTRRGNKITSIDLERELTN